MTDTHHVDQAKVHSIVDIIDYVPDAIVFKTIIEKTSGSITAVAFNREGILLKKSIPFDTFVQIIDGTADFAIDGESVHLANGQCVIIPAHSSSTIKGWARFKMLSTVIKSGYE